MLSEFIAWGDLEISRRKYSFYFWCQTVCIPVSMALMYILSKLFSDTFIFHVGITSWKT